MADVTDSVFVGAKQYKYIRAFYGLTVSGVIAVVVTYMSKPEPLDRIRGLVWGTIGDALAMGGRLLSFVPTIIQVQRFVLALEADGRFQMIESLETMLRTWHVTERSVRPDHRMIAHSGFLTTAVRCDLRPSSSRVQQIVEHPEYDSFP